LLADLEKDWCCWQKRESIRHFKKIKNIQIYQSKGRTSKWTTKKSSSI
jgi:hypothetical protein